MNIFLDLFIMKIDMIQKNLQEFTSSYQKLVYKFVVDFGKILFFN